MSQNIKTEEKAVPQKVPRYLQFYKQEWEKLPIFKGWLSSVAGSRHRAYCRYCRKEFRAHRTDLRSHAKSRKHQRASENYLSEGIYLDLDLSLTNFNDASVKWVPRVLTDQQKERRVEIYSALKEQLLGDQEFDDRKPNELALQTASSEKASIKQNKCSSVTSEPFSKEGPSDNVNEASDSSSPASLEALEIIHPKKVRAYMKGKEKHWRISTQVLDLVRGVPVIKLCVSLLYEKENHWNHLSDGYTDNDGQWYHAFSSDIKVGRYKLHFETRKYFTLGLHDTCYPYIEVVFDITENIQQYHVPLLVSPFGYMVYRGGK